VSRTSHILDATTSSFPEDKIERREFARFYRVQSRSARKVKLQSA
jgi:hypothetical protein